MAGDTFAFGAEEALESGFLSVTGSRHIGDYAPENACKEGETKFVTAPKGKASGLGPGALDGSAKKDILLKYEFIKPIMLKGYCIQVTDQPARRPTEWTVTITESDPQTGQCHQHDLLIQKEHDVSDREPWEMRTYIFKQAKWVKEISLQVQKNYEESDRCEIG